MGQLVKAGILSSHRGPHGGMNLAQEPEQITLLSIVEACQGLLGTNYCQKLGANLNHTCAYHKAMLDVRSSVENSLKRWNLADLANQPVPQNSLLENQDCKMWFLKEE